MKKSRLLLLLLSVGMTVNAIAAPPQEPLTVTVQGDGAVMSEPAGISCPADCDENYKKNTVATLTATADPNSNFLGWSGACVGTNPICEVKVTAPTAVTAMFDTVAVVYPATVPKTGQTLCVDANGPIACTGTGQDGDLQAGVALPTPRFTDNGDGTVTDNATGLHWLKDMTCIGFVSSGLNQWTDAFNWVASFNSGMDLSCADYTPGTFNDWRIANINELHSLINYGFYLPAISNAQGDAKWSEGDPFVNLPVLNGTAPWPILSSTPVSQSAPNSASIHSLLPAIGKLDIDSSGFVWAVRGQE